MTESKKTFFTQWFYKTLQQSQNINNLDGKNSYMIKNSNNSNNEQVKIHIMPPSITDEDISSLFKGIISVVKKKIELEKKAESINMNINHKMLMKELKEKQAEIVRLKNEIIFLKSQLNNK